MSQKNENRGGLRHPKGGRPEKPEAEKRTYHSIGFDKRIWQWLEETHGKDKHTFINNLLASQKAAQGNQTTAMTESPSKQVSSTWHSETVGKVDEFPDL